MVTGCDIACQQYMRELFGITIADSYVYGLENEDTKEVVLVNKCDPKFAQAMQNDVELTFAAKDVKGDP